MDLSKKLMDQYENSKTREPVNRKHDFITIFNPKNKLSLFKNKDPIDLFNSWGI